MTRDRINAMVPAQSREKPKPKAAGSVKVKVAGNWQVSHDGEVAGPGETITVPADVAEAWERAGLVTR